MLEKYEGCFQCVIYSSVSPKIKGEGKFGIRW